MLIFSEHSNYIRFLVFLLSCFGVSGDITEFVLFVVVVSFRFCKTICLNIITSLLITQLSVKVDQLGNKS